MNAKSAKPKTEDTDLTEKLPFCGIIMPIADMIPYEKNHWVRVREVLDEAIEQAGYTPRLVSESEETAIIHASIVQNLYDDAIVVCDVSAKNPNVMFELGMRLAFDKPTIIIKDDRTDYSFDTGTIKHINYRADLRFDDVREFRDNLAGAIKASVARKDGDEGYSPFLRHFHRVKVTNLETTEVSSNQFMLDQMQILQDEVMKLSNKMDRSLFRNEVAGSFAREAARRVEDGFDPLGDPVMQLMRTSILKKTGRYVPFPTLDAYRKVFEKKSDD